MQYYYANHENQTVGPIEESILHGLLKSGIITHKTNVIEEGSSDWMSYQSHFHTPPPPPPSQPPSQSPQAIDSSSNRSANNENLHFEELDHIVKTYSNIFVCSKKFRTFPLEQGGPNRISIERSKKDLHFYFDGKLLETFQSGTEDSPSKEKMFTLPCGGALSITPQDPYKGNDFMIIYNGVAVPGSGSSPEGRILKSSIQPLILCFICFFLGIITTFSQYQIGLLNPLSWNIFAAIFICSWLLLRANNILGIRVLKAALIGDAFFGTIWIIIILLQPQNSNFVKLLVIIFAVLDIYYRNKSYNIISDWPKAVRELKSILGCNN
jgi:hypothetical protein